MNKASTNKNRNPQVPPRHYVIVGLQVVDNWLDPTPSHQRSG